MVVGADVVDPAASEAVDDGAASWGGTVAVGSAGGVFEPPEHAAAISSAPARTRPDAANDEDLTRPIIDGSGPTV